MSFTVIGTKDKKTNKRREERKKNVYLNINEKHKALSFHIKLVCKSEPLIV